MGREALEANVIGGTSHETPAGVRSQSGSTHASELELQSNDTVELFCFRLGTYLIFVTDARMMSV